MNGQDQSRQRAFSPPRHFVPSFAYGRYSARDLDLTHYYEPHEGVKVHYVTTGDRAKPALLLVHGLGGTWETWDQLLLYLSNRAFVICLDLPGHGGSGIPPASDELTADWISRAAAKFVGSLGCTSATAIGFSMGGLAAIHFPRADRQLFRSVVLLNASLLSLMGVLHNPLRGVVRHPKMSLNLTKMIAAVSLPIPDSVKVALVRTNPWLLSGIVSKPRRLAPPLLDSMFQSRRVDQHMLRRLLSEAHHYDYNFYLQSCPADIWAIAGTNDGLESKADADTLLAIRPDAAITSFDGASHWILGEYAQDLADLLTHQLIRTS